jgi:hypothetical protein
VSENEEQSDATEQEAIALLDGRPVPDAPGFTFLAPVRRDGDTFEIQLIQDLTGASIGSARGSNVKAIIERAREIADEFSED